MKSSEPSINASAVGCSYLFGGSDWSGAEMGWAGYVTSTTISSCLAHAKDVGCRAQISWPKIKTLRTTSGGIRKSVLP